MNQHLTHVIYGAVIGHFIMALWRKMLSPAPRVIVVPSKPTDSSGRSWWAGKKFAILLKTRSTCSRMVTINCL